MPDNGYFGCGFGRDFIAAGKQQDVSGDGNTKSDAYTEWRIATSGTIDCDAASGENNAASRENNAASGKNDAASGENDAASGENDAASGESNAASGEDNAASGENNAASGENNAASGEDNAASRENGDTAERDVYSDKRAGFDKKHGYSCEGKRPRIQYKCQCKPGRRRGRVHAVHKV